jgi:hypothetical protein
MSLLDLRRIPMLVFVDEQGVAHMQGNGAAPPEQIAEWLQALADSAKAKAGIELPDVEVRGHKVYVVREGENVRLDAVNDDRPLVRMRFLFGPEDVEDVIKMLREASCGSQLDDPDRG